MPLVLPASSCLATPEILFAPLIAEKGFVSLVFRILKVGRSWKVTPDSFTPALPFSVSDVLRL